MTEETLESLGEELIKAKAEAAKALSAFREAQKVSDSAHSIWLSKKQRVDLLRENIKTFVEEM